MRISNVVVLICFISLTAASTGFGDSEGVATIIKEKSAVDEKWEQEADTNNDGVVDRDEACYWKANHPRHRYRKALVSKAWEEQADTDNDGILEKGEAALWRKRHPRVLVNKAVVNKPWEKRADKDGDGVVEKFELNCWKKSHPKHGRRDNDNNPPGAAGGPGTNWENPPGPRGGHGSSPDRRR